MLVVVLQAPRVAVGLGAFQTAIWPLISVFYLMRPYFFGKTEPLWAVSAFVVLLLYLTVHREMLVVSFLRLMQSETDSTLKRDEIVFRGSCIFHRGTCWKSPEFCPGLIFDFLPKSDPSGLKLWLRSINTMSECIFLLSCRAFYLRHFIFLCCFCANTKISFPAWFGQQKWAEWAVCMPKLLKIFFAIPPRSGNCPMRKSWEETNKTEKKCPR